VPAPVEMSDDELNALGDKMRERIAELRDSTIEKLHVKDREASREGSSRPVAHVLTENSDIGFLRWQLG
jgi:hypothetical protein